MGERYGYVRVSSKGQCEDRQVEGIRKYCAGIEIENMFIEKVSGKLGVDERPEYAVLRRVLRSGDELIVDALDRLGRKKADVKAELLYLKDKGVILRVLSIPTTLKEIEGQAWIVDMINNVIIEVYTSLLEQELVEKERRQADGIAEAKKRGVYKGRKPVEYNVVQFEDLYSRWKSNKIMAKEFMNLVGLKPNTFYRAVHKYEVENNIAV